MNLNYFNFSILLLIILISCSIIVFQIKNTNFKENYNKNLFSFIKNNDDKIEKFENTNKSTLITQDMLDKLNSSNRIIFKNISLDEDKSKRKILAIKGLNLMNIKDVYFETIKGTITKHNNYEINILPPNFGDSKYYEILQKNKIPDFEIIFHIQDDKISNLNLNRANDKIRLQLNDNEIFDEFKKALKQGFSKRIKITINTEENKTIQLESVEYILYKGDNYIHYDLTKNNIINNIITLNTSELSENDKITIEYLGENIDMMFPTGLFYKLGISIVAGNGSGSVDSNDWEIYLKDREEKTLAPNLRNYYNFTRKYLSSEKEAAKDISTPDYTIENLSIKLNNNTNEYEITWDIPDVLKNISNKDDFFYFLEITPKNKNDVSKTSGIPSKKLDILDISDLSNPQLNKMKTNYIFSKDKLVAGEIYNIKFKVIEKKINNLFEEKSLKEIDYDTSSDLEDYHTHLYNSETDRFDLELIDKKNIFENNANLLETYYQMLAYNKKRAQDEVQIANLNVKDNISCLNRNLKQFSKGKMESSLVKNVDMLINSDQLLEGQEFGANQNKQDKNIKKIKDKIKEVEKLQGKKVTLSDLDIKILKSVKDGSLIRLEELNGEKKLVKLNQGCLSFGNNGQSSDYNYVPCNVFDSNQYFKINKVNNLDEYNYLLAINMQPRLDENDNKEIKYPFYVLQPNTSNSCISIDDKKLQIKPCSGEKSFRFNGYFNESLCNV